MRFDRYPCRLSPFAWTPRKLAMASSKAERERAREQARLPLLADQVPPAPRFDLAAETAARQIQHDRSLQSQRDFTARVWRAARRDYFNAGAEVRSEIRSQWLAWRGPATCLYFRYVVDVATGVQQQRVEASRANAAKYRAAAEEYLRAQDGLAL